MRRREEITRFRQGYGKRSNEESSNELRHLLSFQNTLKMYFTTSGSIEHFSVIFPSYHSPLDFDILPLLLPIPSSSSKHNHDPPLKIQSPLKSPLPLNPFFTLHILLQLSLQRDTSVVTIVSDPASHPGRSIYQHSISLFFPPSPFLSYHSLKTSPLLPTPVKILLLATFSGSTFATKLLISPLSIPYQLSTLTLSFLSKKSFWTTRTGKIPIKGKESSKAFGRIPLPPIFDIDTISRLQALRREAIRSYHADHLWLRFGIRPRLGIFRYGL
jgi:hypothetical protein